MGPNSLLYSSTTLDLGGGEGARKVFSMMEKGGCGGMMSDSRWGRMKNGGG